MTTKSLAPVSTVIHASTEVPGSKSITNRALLLAALARGDSILSGVLFSEDSMAFMGGLQALGVNLEVDQQCHQVKVRGCAGQFSITQAAIYCHDAGTATRFLMPACAAVPGNYRFTASPRMQERPIGPLLHALTAQGARFDYEQQSAHMPLNLHSQGLSGGDISVNISQSSQFLSGLLMAAPLARAQTIIHTQLNKPKPYVKMTCQMMTHFGVQTACRDNQFLLRPQIYQACDYMIEPDASTASYFFAAAAITNGNILVKGLPRQGLQGDTQFLGVLEQMGCRVIEEVEGIRVIGAQKLKALDVDMSGFSDTFMTLAVVAVFADQAMTLSGLAHTRLQESDRIMAMANGLNHLGIKTAVTEHSITIYPGQPTGAEVHSYHDHRIAMSLALLGLKVPGVMIHSAEAVAKTCPDYFERMERLIHG